MKWMFVVMALLLACSANLVFSQPKNGIKPGKVTAEDFNSAVSPAIDSSSNAVILSDIGVTDFVGNNKGWFNYVFKRRTRIKVLNRKAFELATIKIPLYVNNDDKEVLTEVSGSTFNLENNQVIETKLGKTDLFANQRDKNHQQQKFTMPAVKEGSIIEYGYTITSPFIFNMPSWEFQNIDYPCLWSEYQVTIPSLLVYMSNKYGVHPFFVSKAEIGHEVYSIVQQRDHSTLGSQDQSLSVNANTSKHRWVMKDVPAFYVENYLSSPINYLDRISFQLHQTNNGETSTDVMPTWAKATDELMKREDFAAFMDADDNNNYWMNDVLAGVVKGSNALEQAKSIYYFVADNFSCTNHYDRTITTTLKEVNKKHSGTVGDINLYLSALLKRKGIHVSPVLLSTREYGYNYPGYPVMDRLNYVICRVEIGGQVYYLDASHPNLGFGNLPENCYNGHARVISRTDSASIYFMPDSIKERKVTMVTVTADEKNKGTFTGSIQSQLGQIESYNLRARLAQQGEQQYFDDVKTAARTEADIVDLWIDSLKQPENPVTIHEDFKMKPAEDADVIYFNPILVDNYRRNPFEAAVRKYPVEMDYPLNNTYLLNIGIPAGYEVEEMPKMARVSYNAGEGSFEYLIQKDAATIQLRCTLWLKRANFDPDEYNTLRDFFSFIVKKESEQIVFKKKK